jgi:prepilin-type N-terminal cleavage/methylation domain-containing protein
MKKENGFTLVEMIVVLFIGSLMFAVIYSIVNSAQRSSSGIERRVIAQQDARSALELMAMEIQMASYNPNLANIWVNRADCVTPSGTQSYRGIQDARANSITIEMDINDNGIIDNTNNNPNETISYAYDVDNRYITRTTNCNVVDQPFLGALNANENTKTVLVVNDEADIPVFRYYNGSGTDISATVVTSPASLTLGIPAIRRVEITLVVDTSYSDPGSGARRRIIYSTSVIPRNHIPVPTY